MIHSDPDFSFDMQLPAAFRKNMEAMLKDEYPDFIYALSRESPTSIRFNPAKAGSEIPHEHPLFEQNVDWCPNGIYLKKRPVFTLDPCLHAGMYYVQEASSMFIDSILKQILPEGPVKILDLCAAPGGKSTLIASLLSPDSLLVCNEVVGNRAAILKENIIKWGHDNIVVTHNQAADFSRFEGLFDVILVDAPCSGEGMFRKDPKAIAEWSEQHVQMCSKRQKQIVTDIWKALKPGGFLVYSTCTYNREENEDVINWMLQQLNAESIGINHPFEHIVSATQTPYSFRFFPHKIKGEGFFTGVVRKQDGKVYSTPKAKKGQNQSPGKLPGEIQQLIRPAVNYSTYVDHNMYGIVPESYFSLIQEIKQHLNVIYCGCELAEINNKKTRWAHSLALYQHLVKENCPCYSADTETALKYLKKEDIPVNGQKGEWILICYKNVGLGWVKNIGNRVNNYLPKEWRIRMEIQ